MLAPSDSGNESMNSKLIHKVIIEVHRKRVWPDVMLGNLTFSSHYLLFATVQC